MSMIPLYGYQKRWIEDRSELKVGRWARSAGKTFSTSLDLVVDCERAEAAGTKQPWFVLTQAEGQTLEVLQYATDHCRVIDLAFEQTVEQVEIDGKEYNQHKIEFEHGSRIVGLPTNKNTVRGKHGSLYWDEPAATPHDEDIWGSAAPIVGRKGRRAIMTGTGGKKRGPFYEACNSEDWSRHVIDVHQAIADGAPLDLEKIQKISRGPRYRVEYLVEFEDDGTRLIPRELITSCEDDATLLVPELWISEERRSHWTRHLDAQLSVTPADQGYDSPEAWKRFFAPLAGRPLYLGYDIARRRHLAVIWITEPDGIFRRTRAVIAFEKRRFAEQKACLWAAMELCWRGCIDSGGMGEQMAEEAVERFGERVEPVAFSGPIKEDLALRMLQSYEDHKPRIPPSPVIRDSIHSVYKAQTAAGNVRYDADATEDAGHADHFWAQALSLMATGDGITKVPELKSFGTYTFGDRQRSFIA